MGNWREENQSLICEIKRGWAGCGYVFIGIVGFFILLGAGLYLLVLFTGGADGEPPAIADFGVPSLIFLFGSVFFMGAFGGGRFNFYSRVRIDRNTETLELMRVKDRVEYRMALAEVGRIELQKVMKSSSGSNSRPYPTYQIFLVKRDGAFFWLDTFTNKEKFVDAVTLLASYTGLGVKDGTGLVAEVDRQREYTDRFGDSSSYEPSRYVEMTPGGDGTRITIQEKRTLYDRLMMVLVFTLFLSAPFVILSQFFSTTIDDAGSWIFLVFVGPFCLIFLSIVVLIFITTSKVYEIRQVGYELRVLLRFRLAPLTKLLGRELAIPRSAIKAIRVNRLDEGHFWLSVATDGSVPTGAGGFLLGLGAFRKPGQSMSSPWGDRSVISLWEVPGWTKTGAGIADLLHIEATLQRDLGIDESNAGA